MADERQVALSRWGAALAVAVAAGELVGAGVFRVPGPVAALLPGFWAFIAVWVIGGAYALLVARAGRISAAEHDSERVFARHALGSYAGFACGWSEWLATCAAVAAIAMIASEYALVLFPHLRATAAVALLVIALLVLFQWFGLRPAARFHNALSAVKVGGVVAVIAICFFLGGRNPVSAAFETTREGSFVAAFVVALELVIFAYAAWPLRAARDLEVAHRSRIGVPAVAVVAALYVLLDLAIVRVAPLATVAGERLALATVARHLFGPRGDTGVRTLVILVVLAAAAAALAASSRIVLALSREGLFWRFAREVNAKGTPDVALLISSAVAALFVVSGSVESVIAKLAFLFVANQSLAFAPQARKSAGLDRLWMLLGLAASVVFLVAALAADTENALWSVALLAVSFPLYLLLHPEHG